MTTKRRRRPQRWAGKRQWLESHPLLFLSLLNTLNFEVTFCCILRYESATDAGVSTQGQWEAQCLPGVPRRELIYQPLQTEWTTPEHTPHTLTPHTLTPTPDQGLVEAEGEGDSGFQEVAGCIGLPCPPLVSPERAKEALMLSKHLVPMVGPQLTPMSDELSTTYMEKARQASEYTSLHKTTVQINTTR